MPALAVMKQIDIRYQTNHMVPNTTDYNSLSHARCAAALPAPAALLHRCCAPALASGVPY